MLVIEKKYLNSICEIKNQNNDTLAQGKVTDITNEYLEVTYKDDLKVVLVANTIVKISLFNSNAGSKVYMGRVYIGSDTQIRLVEIVTLMDFEKRDYFRINIFEHTLMFKEETTVVQAESKTVPSFEITINNISLCGVFFLSTEHLKMGDTIYILLDLSIGKTILKSKINRVSHDYPEKTGYGCEFQQLTPAISDSVYKFIHTKQVEYILMHK